MSDNFSRQGEHFGRGKTKRFNNGFDQTSEQRTESTHNRGWMDSYQKLAETDILNVRSDKGPEFYFNQVKHHFSNDQNIIIRLHGYEDAIPNLIKISELLELSGMAEKIKIKFKEIAAKKLDQ